MDESIVVKLYIKDVIMDRASVTWKIPIFKKTCVAFNADRFIESPEFQCSGASWELKLYPHGTRQSNGIVNISLKKLTCEYWPASHVVSASFTVPCNGGPDKTCDLYETVIEGAFEESKHLEIMKRESLLDNKSAYLENGILTIECDMIVFNISRERCKEEMALENNDDGKNIKCNEVDTLHLRDYSFKDDIAALLADIEALHSNSRFADVILKLGDHEFPAHKVILRSRSKVFAAMFEHDMKENQQDTVDLVDMEVHTVKDMLSYIYSGKIRQLSPEEALNLYIAADRYDLQKLVFNCRKIMLNELSIDNISEIAAAADSHKDQLLMDAVKSFLYKNMKDVFMTEKWKTFSRENQTLSLNLIQSAVINN